jgi:hypothetical protein
VNAFERTMTGRQVDHHHRGSSIILSSVIVLNTYICKVLDPAAREERKKPKPKKTTEDIDIDPTYTS